MDYDRLRDLQAKFEENPRRYFAPLANEYRKGGNPKRAIEICRAHLAQMPGHMSGQVVYGQALFEGAEFEEARKVFEGAIVLDPENLIALRSLGDLALQAGNTEEARTWYNRLLEADPKDTAVIALVAEIDAAADPAATAAASEGDSTFVVDFSFVDKPGAEPGADDTAAGRENVDLAQADLGDESRPVDSAVEGLTSRQPDPESPVPPPESSVRPDEESALAEGGSGTSRAEGQSADADAPLGLERHYPAEDGTTQSATPSAAEESLPVPEPMGPDRDADVAAARPAAPSAAQPTGSSFAGTSGAPEPFVNETMAQLYLQQGYRQLALRVYRQLSEMRPTEQALRDRIAEIEAMQTAEDRGGPAARRDDPSIESPTPRPSGPRSPSIESPVPHGPSGEPGSVESPSFDRQPVDSPPPSSPSREPDSVESPVREEPRADPEGIAARQPSIREFFATLGRRRPPRPAGQTSWAGSESGNRPAGEGNPSASLDSVFAGANVSAKDARAASALAGAFSASARGASPPPPTPTTPTPRANPRLQSQESEEDVAKFRAWLDGLTGE
ncbi:MAG TPA: tetratricopeptide repeat protein [Gemmatimonadaceae bacterium]|nr:tetratricopeptide repeat protein [Gemmatimonadaceae bacterium]